MIYMTEAAANAVRTAIAGASGPVEGLRIMVESGGCAGYRYKMGLVAEAQPADVVIEHDGFKIFLDTQSEALLSGTTINFTIGAEGAGFTFENPNASSNCSCGKSFG